GDAATAAGPFEVRRTQRPTRCGSALARESFATKVGPLDQAGVAGAPTSRPPWERPGAQSIRDRRCSARRCPAPASPRTLRVTTPPLPGEKQKTGQGRATGRSGETMLP